MKTTFNGSEAEDERQNNASSVQTAARRIFIADFTVVGRAVGNRFGGLPITRLHKAATRSSDEETGQLERLVVVCDTQTSLPGVFQVTFRTSAGQPWRVHRLLFLDASASIKTVSNRQLTRKPDGERTS